MTAERAIYLQWVKATDTMNGASGSIYFEALGASVALNQVLADFLGVTFIEANRLLLNWQMADEAAG